MKLCTAIVHYLHILCSLKLPHGHRSQMPILVVLRLEERIAKCDCLDTLHVDICDKLGIDIEEHWHVDRLARVEALLLEAEALNLTKVRRDLAWRYRVCCDSNDVLIRLVGRCVKRERSFAGQNADFALLRDEFPGEDV